MRRLVLVMLPFAVVFWYLAIVGALHLLGALR
jgi:hypothetical protein